ncbi:MAG: hypothetical protein Q9162_005716 [Coniocarpon cinnabarinum]
MIIRESPSPKKSTVDSEWPPKSPHAALTASPSGRKRLEKYYQHRRKISPSPRTTRPPHSDANDAAGSDDDEETLQLQLQAIEAKLKLKKLRKEKTTTAQHSEQAVEVPSSPRRNDPQPSVAQSPRRTQLGIDKGLKASDVSLKNVPSPSKSRARSNTVREDAPRQKAAPSGKSYAERLLASRNDDQERKDRQRDRIAGRSCSFVLQNSSSSSQKENEGSEERAIKSGHERSTQHTAARGSPLREQSRRSPRQHHQPSSTDIPPDQNTDHDPHSGFTLSKRNTSPATLDDALESMERYPLPRLLKEVHAPHYDSPDVAGDYVVFGIIASKSKPRDHALTNHSTSSDPDAKPQRSKFMVLRLTDLEWEIDLFLFGEGFETFWKLAVGTVVAILNPGIMPPKPHARDSGKFSLKLGSSEDTVLEIGPSADLAFCKSVKSDGQVCGQWIDGRRTDYCEFHVGLQVARSKSSRMEINTMGTFGLFSKPGDGKRGSGGRGRGRGRGGSNSNPFSGGRKGREQKKDGTLQNQYYDREAHERAFVIPSSLSHGASTAKLLDAEDYGPGGGLSAAERSQKRRALQEKERDLARALGDRGNGIGVEYLRSAHEEPRDRGSDKTGQRHDRIADETKDASSFGLVRNSRDPINLDPVNGRKSRKEAVGWSKAFKRGLSPTTRNRSPSPKKARFVLDGKGVRTPGADSSHEERLRMSTGKKRRPLTLDDEDDLELV